MIVRKMLAHELDTTVILFNYYRDEAIEAMPVIAEQYDENSMVETIRKYAIDYECIWLNAYEGQRPVGFVGGYISACPWNNQMITANIAFIYMLPSHRSIDNFRQLLNEFENWARLVKATEITAGDIGIDIARSQKIYEHFGFNPILMMTKEMNNV